MSKKTTSPQTRIRKISSKIQILEEKLLTATGKQKQRIKREICGKKSTLRYLCKLYVWAVN